VYSVDLAAITHYTQNLLSYNPVAIIKRKYYTFRKVQVSEKKA